jgi:hypothetical protein
MVSLVLFGIFFLWIVALKVVANCEQRWVPGWAAGGLAGCLLLAILLGGDFDPLLLIIPALFFLIAFISLWILQRTTGILIFLFLAVVGTALLFFVLPNLAEWIVAAPEIDN